MYANYRLKTRLAIWKKLKYTGNQFSVKNLRASIFVRVDYSVGEP